MRDLKRVAASVAVAAAPAAIIALGAGTATAVPQPNPNGATKVDITTQNKNCDASVAGGSGSGQGSGFAIINTTPQKQQIVELHLMKATPNTDYRVRLVDVPGDCNSPVADTTLHTNAAGNANLNLHGNALANATGAWVLINSANAPLNDYYTSNVATINTAP